MTILNGQQTAARLINGLREEVENIKSPGGRVPCLCIFLVEGDEGSEVYVRNKRLAADRAGVETRLVRLPHDAAEQMLIEAIDAANADDDIDAIIVQLPLPAHIDEKRVLSAVMPGKDADIRIKEDAVSLLLQLSGVDAEEREVVVSENNRPCSLKAEHIPEGAVVIDMGFTCLTDPAAVKGYRIVGDADIESIRHKAAYLAPVPGGIGPMIIAVLMLHTVNMYKHKMKIELV